MMKTTTLIIGIICMICLAVLVPAVSALTPFNRSAVSPGDSFYSESTIVTTPEGATFSKPVTISFTLSQDQWQQALEVTNGNTAGIVIAALDIPNKQWIIESATTVTTTANGSHVVTGTTTHTGVFSVFYIVQPLGGTASPTPETFGQMGTPAVGVSQTPAVAPVVKTTVSAKPTTKKSPMLVPGIIVIGLIGLVGYFIARKKE
jgi:hypothetical protein